MMRNCKIGACVAWGLVFCWCFGCPAISPAQQLFPRIINGDPTEDFPSVGIVGIRGGVGFCTGTLVDPWFVLTAAHCAEVIPDDASGSFEVGGQVYVTARIHIHPDYNSNTLANDIALLELSEPVLEVVPSPIFRQAPRVDEVLTIVGFGSGGDASGDNGDFGIKRVGTVAIDDIEPTLVIWVFDDPQESNTASGDSGGPGFLEVEGEFFVASVTSSGTEPDAGLGDIAFNARVDMFATWIDLVIASAGGPSDDPDDDDSNDDRPNKCPVGNGDRPQYGNGRPPWGSWRRPPQGASYQTGFRRPPSRLPPRRPQQGIRHGSRGGPQKQSGSTNRFSRANNRSRSKQSPQNRQRSRATSNFPKLERNPIQRDGRDGRDGRVLPLRH